MGVENEVVPQLDPQIVADVLLLRYAQHHTHEVGATVAIANGTLYHPVALFHKSLERIYRLCGVIFENLYGGHEVATCI